MKITVRTPLVEMDGDEMTRIIWSDIKRKLLEPYLDMRLEYYDLGVQHRDETDDRVTSEAAHAVLRHGVGVKCATVTPDADRVVEYGLKKAWPSPNATIRGILDGTVFRKPIPVSVVRPAIRSWVKPIVVGRHAYGDIYKAVDYVVPGPGTAELVFTPAEGSPIAGSAAPLRFPVHTFGGGGVLMAMHNTDASIRSFASACVMYALSERMDLWFSAKDTISKKYHGRFRDIFAEVVAGHARELEAAGVGYRYMLNDDAVAQIVKHPGGILWACMNYDGDIMSDMVAAGFGSLGMMTSVLVSPKGCFEYEAAHGTVRRHYYEHLAGRPTSTNSVASIFAWTGALRKRGELDATPEVCAFADTLEKAVLDTIEAGTVTKDLWQLMERRPQAWADTGGFLDAIAARLATSVAAAEGTGSR